MPSNFFRVRGELRRMIEDLMRKSQSGMDLAMDRMFALQPETYLRYEERFSELIRLFSCLQEELERAADWNALDRLQRRVFFLEDRFEDVDSVLRNRPKKIRTRLPWDRMFRMAGANGGGRRGEPGNRLSVSEACRILGIEDGTTFPEIRKRFRRLMKELHPDVRMGDRSAEGQMRLVIDAYEVLKRMHST